MGTDRAGADVTLLRRLWFVACFVWRPVTGPCRDDHQPWTLAQWWAVRLRWSEAWTLARSLNP